VQRRIAILAAIGPLGPTLVPAAAAQTPETVECAKETLPCKIALETYRTVDENRPSIEPYETGEGLVVDGQAACLRVDPCEGDELGVRVNDVDACRSKQFEIGIKACDRAGWRVFAENGDDRVESPCLYTVEWQAPADVVESSLAGPEAPDAWAWPSRAEASTRPRPPTTTNTVTRPAPARTPAN
jgi:hypothetical protein